MSEDNLFTSEEQESLKASVRDIDRDITVAHKALADFTPKSGAKGITPSSQKELDGLNLQVDSLESIKHSVDSLVKLPPSTSIAGLQSALKGLEYSISKGYSADEKTPARDTSFRVQTAVHKVLANGFHKYRKGELANQTLYTDMVAGKRGVSSPSTEL